MAQLMSRLRTGTVSDSYVAEPEPVIAAPMSVVNRDDTRMETLTPANPLKASEYVPRGVAPEKTSTLDALRQIANQSVVTAIQTSTRKRNRDNSVLYLGGMGVGFFFSVVLFLLSNGWTDLVFLLGCLSAAGCIACAYVFIRSSLSIDPLVKRRAQELSDSATQGESPDQPAASVEQQPVSE
jgi:hypothetical protein